MGVVVWQVTKGRASPRCQLMSVHQLKEALDGGVAIEAAAAAAPPMLIKSFSSGYMNNAIAFGASHNALAFAAGVLPATAALPSTQPARTPAAAKGRGAAPAPGKQADKGRAEPVSTPSACGEPEEGLLKPKRRYNSTKPIQDPRDLKVSSIVENAGKLWIVAEVKSRGDTLRRMWMLFKGNATPHKRKADEEPQLLAAFGLPEKSFRVKHETIYIDD